MIKTFLFILLPMTIFAKSFMLSNIPLPKTYVQDLDPNECDEVCMQSYLDEGKVFSFLANANKRLENQEQNDAKTLFISILNLGAFNSTGQLKIALLLPYKKIGKYASSTTNASFAYLITKGHPFTLKSYKIETENRDDIANALAQMQADGFEYIIAPLTYKGAVNVVEINPALHVYFPTINKKDITTSSSFLSFGAIDYNAQSYLLLQEATSPLVIFSDKSSTGKRLANYQKEEFLHPSPMLDEQEANEFQNSDRLHGKKRVVRKHFLSRKTTNLEIYLKKKKSIVEGSFFINTRIIKSGMIMSQLTLYDVQASSVLSTQINYNPLLLSMTQYVDRKNMIVANSITINDNILIETNSLLGNDIVYDWINYTTTVGMDYFYSLITDEDRTYNTVIDNNQMVYDIELLRPAKSKFVKYRR